MVARVKSEIVVSIFEKKPHVCIASGFLTISIQNCELATFYKILKFVPLIIYNCEPIFHFIRVLNFTSVRKRCPLFLEKKTLGAITSVSLQIKLESLKWQPL